MAGQAAGPHCASVPLLTFDTFQYPVCTHNALLAIVHGVARFRVLVALFRVAGLLQCGAKTAAVSGGPDTGRR
jgi:hypothetical protein